MMLCFSCRDDKGDLIRCLDCGPEVTRCIDCTLNYHKECHLLHKPELLLETSIRPFLLRSCFVRQNHQCSSLRTKTIQVFDEKGRHHDCWFKSCECETEGSTLLRWQLWPNTLDQPRLAYHMDLLRWFESLLTEGGLSLMSACRAVTRKNSLTPDEASTLYQNLVSGCFDAFRQFRVGCNGLESAGVANGSIYGKKSDGEAQLASAEDCNEGDTMIKFHRTSSEAGSDKGTEEPGSTACLSLTSGTKKVIFPGNPGSEAEDGGGMEHRPAIEDWTNGSDENAELIAGDLKRDYFYIPVQEPIGMNPNDTSHQPPLTSSRKRRLPVSDRPPSPLVPSASLQDGSPQQARPGEIVVMCTSNDGKNRVWDKRHYCFFCREPFSKLPRHLETIHCEEPDIKLLRKANCPDVRKQILCVLRNLGNHLHNCTVLQKGEGTLIVRRRPSEGESRVPEEYTPCPHCYGYFIRSDLAKHICLVKDAGIHIAAIKTQ